MIEEDCRYHLAQTYIKKLDFKSANTILEQNLSYYRLKGQKSSLLLSQTWYEKGKISLQREDFSQALLAFQEAEISGQDSLSPDQRINIWIHQSQCYKNKRMGSSNEAAFKSCQ